MKRYQPKRFEVKLPHLETIAKIWGTNLTVEGEKFRVSNEDKKLIKINQRKTVKAITSHFENANKIKTVEVLSSRSKNKSRSQHSRKETDEPTSSVLKNRNKITIEHQEPETRTVFSNDASNSEPVEVIELWTEEPCDGEILWTEEPCDGEIGREQAYNTHYDEFVRLLSELEEASIRIPRMKAGELKGGVPVVRVNNEVFRVPQEVKEHVEKVNERYCALRIDDTKKKYFKNEFNSSSVFYEKEEKLIDRAYFHVLKMETCGENEVYLDGIFVEDVPSPNPEL